jgi:hypothetical protein
LGKSTPDCPALGPIHLAVDDVPEGQIGEGEVAKIDTEGKSLISLIATGEWTREDMLKIFGVDAEGSVLMSSVFIDVGGCRACKNGDG